MSRRKWNPKQAPTYTYLVGKLRANPRPLTLPDKAMAAHVIRAMAASDFENWPKLSEGQREEVLVAAIATVLEEQGLV